MVQKSQTTTWDLPKNPVNNGITYHQQYQLVQDFWTINVVWVDARPPRWDHLALKSPTRCLRLRWVSWSWCSMFKIFLVDVDGVGVDDGEGRKVKWNEVSWKVSSPLHWPLQMPKGLTQSSQNPIFTPRRPGIWTSWTVSWYLMGRCELMISHGFFWCRSAICPGLGDLLYKGGG